MSAPGTAAAADALVWLAITKPPGAAGYVIAVITLLTAFASWIALRTVVLAVRPARRRTSSRDRVTTRLTWAAGSKQEPQSRLARSVHNDRRCAKRGYAETTPAGTERR